MYQIWSIILSLYRQTLPDSGSDDVSAQRVGDPYIGFESIQQLEDVLIVCDKKSEVLHTLQLNYL